MPVCYACAKGDLLSPPQLGVLRSTLSSLALSSELLLARALHRTSSFVAGFSVRLRTAAHSGEAESPISGG